MAGSTRSSSGGRRSWRQGSRAGAASRGIPVRESLLVATFLLFSGATAFFLWLFLRPDTRPQTYWINVVAAPRQSLVTPPEPFVEEDLAALQTALQNVSQPKTKLAFWRRQPTLVRVNRINLENPDVLTANVGGVLGPVLGHDAVVAYVRAPGVGDGTQAYLECGAGLDAQPRRCDLATLLNALGGSAARTLVILDGNQVESDPRSGLFANDFPRQVEIVVRQLANSRLYVLVAHSMFESSAVSYADRRTIFTQTLAEALRGDADRSDEGGNNDGQVSSHELFGFVQRHLRDVGQTPLWMQGGRGLVTEPLDADDWLLHTIDRTPTKAEETPATDAASKAKSSGVAGSNSTNATTTGTGAAPASNGTSTPTPPKTTAPPTAEPAKSAPANPAPGDSQPGPANPTAPGSGTPGSGTPGSTAPDSAASVPAKPAAPESTSPEAAPERAPTSDAAKDRSSTPQATAAPPAAPPAIPNNSALRPTHELWRRRDELASRQGNGWSPIDFAPHQWRELNAYLIAFERHAHVGADWSDDGEERAALSVEVGLYLDRLAEAMRADARAVPMTGDTPTSVGARLLQAWNEFHGSESYRAFRANAIANDQLARARRLARAYADGLFLLPDVVDLNRLLYFHAGDQRQRLGRLTRYAQDLTATLNALDRRWSAPEPLDVLALDALEEASERMKRTVSDLRNEIDALVNEACRGVSQSNGGGPLIYANRRLLEQLLRTPLLTAEQRRQSTESLDTPCPRVPPAVESRHSTADRLQLSNRQWADLQTWIDLEMRASLLLRSSPSSEEWATDSRLFQAAPDESQRWIWLARQGAKSLGRHEQLMEVVKNASRLNDAPASTDAITLATRTRKLAMSVDPRDAFEFDNELATVAPSRRPLAFVDLRIAPQLVERLDFVTARHADRSLDASHQIAIATAGWTALEIDFQRISQQASDVSVRWSFDPALLEVRAKEQVEASDDRPIQPDTTTLSLPVDSQGCGTVSFRVRARQERKKGDPETYALQVHLSAAGVTPPRAFIVNCELPTLTRVELLATREGLPLPLDRVGDKGVRLRPFAHRATGYTLSLRNQSGKPKTVQVELYAVRRPPGSYWPPGRLFLGTAPRPELAEFKFHRLDQLTPDLRIAESPPIPLPSDDREVPIKWSPPPTVPGGVPGAPSGGASPAAGSSGPATATPSATPGVARPAESTDVTQGLFCVVKTLEPPDDPVIKWIEIVPASPADFLNAHLGVDKRNANRQRMELRLGRDGADAVASAAAPASFLGDEITMLWEERLATGEVLKMSSDKSVWNPANPTVVLTAPFDRSEGAERIQRRSQLSVDGYPRAFTWRLTERDGHEREQTRKHVRITSLSLGGSNLEYRRADQISADDTAGESGPAAKPVNPDESAAAPLRVIRWPEGEPVVFRMPRGAQRMHLSFEVDAPFDAFNRSRPGDAILVRVAYDAAEEQTLREFYADRAVRTSVKPPAPDGTLTLTSTVADYEISEALDAPPRRVSVELRWNGELERKSADIVLDEHPPQVMEAHGPQSVTPGQVLVVEALVTDDSNVEEVEIELTFSDDASGIWDEKTKAVQLANPPARSVKRTRNLNEWALEFRIPTSDPAFVAAANTNYAFTRVRARDKVEQWSEWKVQAKVTKLVRSTRPKLVLPARPPEPPPNSPPPAKKN